MENKPAHQQKWKKSIPTQKAIFLTLLTALTQTNSTHASLKSYDRVLLRTNSTVLTPSTVNSSFLQSISTPPLQGVLYQGFGNNNGTSYIPFHIVPGYPTAEAEAMAIQSDGKIVLGGTSVNGDISVSRYSIARFLTNGLLDPSFGQVGTTQAGTNYINFSIIPDGLNFDSAHAMAVQPNGNLLLGGTSIAHDGSIRYALASFLTTGLLDTSFGQVGTSRAGTTYIDFAIAGFDNDRAYALALQSDNKILLGGWSQNADGYPRYSLARFLSNGILDTSFGPSGNGTAYINFSIAEGNNDQAYALTLQSDGKIVLGGWSVDEHGNTRYSVARFLSTGILDTSFGPSSNGTAYVPFDIIPGGQNDDEAKGIGILPDGRIVLGGWSRDVDFPGPQQQYHFSLACFLPNGTLDTTFGQTGTSRAGTTYINFNIAGATTTQIFDQAYTLTVQPNSKILLGGTSNDADGISRCALARFLPNGILDTTFGQINTPRAGTAYINFSVAGGNEDHITVMACQPNGIIISGGYSAGDGIVFSVEQFVGGDSLAYYQSAYPTQGGFY